VEEATGIAAKERKERKEKSLTADERGFTRMASSCDLRFFFAFLAFFCGYFVLVFLLCFLCLFAAIPDFRIYSA